MDYKDYTYYKSVYRWMNGMKKWVYLGPMIDKEKRYLDEWVSHILTIDREASHEQTNSNL